MVFFREITLPRTTADAARDPPQAETGRPLRTCGPHRFKSCPRIGRRSVRRPAPRPMRSGTRRRSRERPDRQSQWPVQELPTDRSPIGVADETAADVERGTPPQRLTPAKSSPGSQKWNQRQPLSDLAKLSGWYFFRRSLYPLPCRRGV
jgi:hypothetical protein